MPRIVWSQASQRDLRRIDSYLSERNAAAAVRILKAVRERAEQLRRSPHMGAALPQQLRYLVVRSTPYVIVYTVTDARVEILRIRHSRENRRDGS